MNKRQKERIERLMPGGVPKFVRCYDNGGETMDRYTVVFTGPYRHKTGGEFWYTGMSANPFHPQGFGQHGGFTRSQLGHEQWHVDRPKSSHLGRRIKFDTLPENCRKLIDSDYRYLWDLLGRDGKPVLS